MTGLRILFTGSRDFCDPPAVRCALVGAAREAGAPMEEVTVVHGGCRTGLDAIVDEVAREYGCRVEVVEADWKRHGKAAGPIRNGKMAARGADLCLGFPLGESRGTYDCMRQAHKAGIRVVKVTGVEA